MARLDAPLSAYLARLAAAGDTATYAQAADALGIEEPHRIHQLTQALEASMELDAAADRPFRAAVIVSRTRGGLPAPGFFVCAARLGRYDGPEDGPAAAAFHRAQIVALGSGF